MNAQPPSPEQAPQPPAIERPADTPGARPEQAEAAEIPLALERDPRFSEGVVELLKGEAFVENANNPQTMLKGDWRISSDAKTVTRRNPKTRQPIGRFEVAEDPDKVNSGTNSYRANYDKTKIEGYAGTAFGEHYIAHTDNKGMLQYTPLSRFDFSGERLSAERKAQLQKVGFDINFFLRPLSDFNVANETPPEQDATGNGESETKNENPQPEQTSTAEQTEESLGEKVEIDYPESIANNYTVRRRESGLLVTESRAYNSSKTHKSDEENRLRTPGIDGPIPEKQRGIVVTERQHSKTGQTYYVAERPASRKRRGTDETAPEGNNGGQPENPSQPDNPEAHEPMGYTFLGNMESPDVPAGTKAFDNPSYSIGIDGGITMRYGKAGDVMDWSQSKHASRPDREILIHATDAAGNDVVWYVLGNRIHELMRPKREGLEPSMAGLRIQDLEEGRQLPAIAIGQDLGDGLIIRGVQVKPDNNFYIPGIKKPEIEKNLKFDPFKRAQDMVAHAELAARGAPMDAKAESIFYDAAMGQLFHWEGPSNQPENMDADAVIEKLEFYSDLFKDETFVPSSREYMEMRKIAEMLQVDEDGYINTPNTILQELDGRPLDPALVSNLFENLNPDRWLMNDFQRKLYKKKLVSKITFRDEFEKDSGLMGGMTGALTIPEFLEIRYKQKEEEDARRLAKGQPITNEPRLSELEKDYYTYLSRKVELGKLVSDLIEKEKFGRKAYREVDDQTPRPIEFSAEDLTRGGLIDYLSRMRDRIAAEFPRRRGRSEP